MGRRWKNIFGFLILILALVSFSSPVQSLMVYTRGSKSPLNQNSPSRFRYTHPFYKARQAKPKPPCKRIGRAICLTPKEPKSHVYTRHPPALTKPKVHPYVRKIFKPSIRRIN